MKPWMPFAIIFNNWFIVNMIDTHTAKTMNQFVCQKWISFEIDLKVLTVGFNCYFQFHYDSLLSLTCNTAKSSSKLIVKFGSSPLVSSLTLFVKTFTTETQRRLIFSVILNSYITLHVLYTGPCICREIPLNCLNKLKIG